MNSSAAFFAGTSLILSMIGGPLFATDPALTQNVTGDEVVAPAGERVQIRAGHVDMGATIMDGFELMARDDTSESPVWRHLSDVVFVIGQEGKLQVPSDPAYEFTRAEGEAWVVPQHEIAGVPWLGWNTQHPKLLELAPDGVDLIFEGHEGPGVLTTFVEAGNFSGPQVIWDSTLEHSQAIHIEPATHTHVSWVFTEPGEHLVRVTAQAKVG
ncbi:MAG: choice-of-anchor M domain-containing protein, partial [Actinomycetaceae bacterium]|nr:choice-of-anchor M domain-containing protein [Actinomycetaceae bacterium]